MLKDCALEENKPLSYEVVDKIITDTMDEVFFTSLIRDDFQVLDYLDQIKELPRYGILKFGELYLIRNGMDHIINVEQYAISLEKTIIGQSRQLNDLLNKSIWKIISERFIKFFKRSH